MSGKYRVLMVCMGNICRSPTAEGVFRHLVREAGLEDRIEIDSAGTHDYHVGMPPDRRSTHHASLRGYDLSALRARQVHRTDFEKFDLVIAMDWQNFELLDEQCPPALKPRLRRLMEFAPELGLEEVSDPYYGGKDGFEAVLDHVEAACAGLLEHVKTRMG
ncbi:low molecular weight protein-tyrosine-phosphatase [Ramlibacter albus]|uniref:protein-tyrosine-phosphatase n=1 Tax=Ramlibacter albus TaxID=2079448 RepID=A0A923M9J9_9BURK|nr:low molecular weight protein-tyrosine-phosphatase [Ramlibacter albus]MBC5766797.1 low molecular weight phosphotyrosine protein phosphatase [Ramlibacter albus]